MTAERTEPATQTVHSVRGATGADVPWLLELACEIYPEWKSAREPAVAWIGNAVQAPGALFLRTDDAALCVATVVWFFRPEQAEGHLIFAGARRGAHFQLLALIEAAIPWLRERGCTSFRIGADTGVDFGPYVRGIARRHGLSWTQDQPAYRIAL